MPAEILKRALATDPTPRTYAGLREVASRAMIDAAVARGEVTRLLPNQYCLAEYDESWAMRAHAAVHWAGPGAAVTGLPALAVRGVAPAPIDFVQVAVPAWRHRTGPTWLRVRSLTMPYATSTWSPRTEVTMPDLALVLGYGAVASRYRSKLLYGSLRANLVSPTELRELAESLTRVPAKRELIARLKRIEAGAESFLEERAMSEILRGAVFADIIFQHRVRVRGERARIDAFHPATLTAIEFDSAEHHGEPENRQSDVNRDALLASIDIETLRFTYLDVMTRPQWCRELILEVIATRANRASRA